MEGRQVDGGEGAAGLGDRIVRCARERIERPETMYDLARRLGERSAWREQYAADLYRIRARALKRVDEDGRPIVLIGQWCPHGRRYRVTQW